MNRKGFLFTVTVFLVLMYILLTISVWVKGIETSERAFSEFYKESTVELAIEQITPAKLDNVTYVILNRGVSRLNDNAINYPLLQGTSEENENIESALYELLTEGSADPSYFHGSGGDISTPENSSLNAWAENLNSSLLAIGVYISEFEVTNFKVGQSDIDLVNYSFDIELKLRDFTNTSAVARSYHIENEIDVSGLVDPALARETSVAAGEDLTAYRQFFFNKDDYSEYSDITVHQMSASTTEGQGWVYGPLALANGTDDLVPEATSIAPSKRSQYILVGDYSEIIALDQFIYNQFAGFILTDTPTVTSTACGNVQGNTFNAIEYSSAPECEIGMDHPFTGKPFIVSSGFSPASAPECPILDGNEQIRRCVLFVNTYLESEVAIDPTRKLVASGSGIYEVEEIRDFVMCGYYTHNPKAPSYMQRLLNDSYLRNSTEFGIETFVIGNYANEYSVYDTRSRLDRELLNGSIDGVKIRGLPGCRNFASCADSPITGIFAVSDDSAIDYGLDDIACDNGAAGCDS
ncbi:hypothetical protein KKE92_04635 [Candidatus Micrarchaeota archaeon]|nr:hypothetical protein [Candidatus Micrarchaeota archaeon]MBU1681745.1 hypothetical protein [Candidatus Micrarchaeota archaeon]